MKLNEITMVAHPSGRMAMMGWRVKITEGVGTILKFYSGEPELDTDTGKKKLPPQWVAVILMESPQDVLGQQIPTFVDQVECI